MTRLRIERATHADLAVIRAAYAQGRAAQRELGSDVWPEFGDEGILREIDAGQLFRMSDGDAIAGIFSLAFEDPAIWGCSSEVRTSTSIGSRVVQIGPGAASWTGSSSGSPTTVAL